MMTTLVIDRKKYVVLEQKEYNSLLQKVALKTPAARKLSLADGKKLAYKLIDKWHSEK